MHLNKTKYTEQKTERETTYKQRDTHVGMPRNPSKTQIWKPYTKEKGIYSKRKEKYAQ